MNTKNATIERLEGRQLLSAAPVHSGNEMGAAKPLFADSAAVVFQGNAVTARGAVVASLQMTVEKAGNGFSDQLVVTDTNDSGTADLTLSMNAAGQFLYHGTADGILELSGQMNAADTAISGTWVHAGGDGISRGTMRLTEVSTTPAAPIVSVANYAGTATDQKNETSPITVTITDTSGVRTAALVINNNNGATPISFTITSGLTFDFSFTQPNETDTVVGRMSADGATITGRWTAVKADGTGHGTFVATRT